jgi:DNA-binding winged helix-turn-helix (wHTH) protein/TolB-like protein
MDRLRFGIYDFSPSTGELRRDGTAVRLQAQPARVLAALLQRPGELVTRETLQAEVWGAGTHVDFDRGLNFCVAQVRAALGDSAEAPRYIETVPRQGYRFIAPVMGAAAPATAAPSSEPAAVRHTARGGILAAALAILVLVAAGIAYNRTPLDPPAVVVVPFYNETGRPELDPLARAMGDVTVAKLAAPERRAALSVIGNAPALKHPFARQDVQGIALDLDAGWVVIGQLKADGSARRVIAHLIRAADMKHVWAQTYDDESLGLAAQTRIAEAIAAAVASNLRAGR